jgi:hypothetical protein
VRRGEVELADSVADLGVRCGQPLIGRH